MKWQDALLAIGLAIEFVSLIYYIRSILGGPTRPHPISWAGWTVIGAVGAWAARSAGAGLGFYIAASFVAITLCIFIISLRPGYAGGMDERAPTDFPVLVAGIILLVLRVVHTSFLHLSDPPVQATLAVLGDTCFVWFTLKKVLEKPESEPLWPWLGAVFASAIGVVVLGSFNYTSMAYPVYLVVADAAIVGAILIGRSVRSERTKGRR